MAWFLPGNLFPRLLETYSISLLRHYPNNISLRSSFLKLVGAYSLYVFWVWLRYHSQVLYGRLPSRPRIIVFLHVSNCLFCLGCRHARRTSMSRSTRLIRVVDLRRCPCICKAADSFLHSVIGCHTVILCSRTNDRIASEAIALTCSTSIRLWTLQDIHLMVI